uniref:Chitinase n=1 Tax=Anopheles culicifacies TaxID=139723 RepID=A0A182LZU2_9DIPT
MTIVGAWLVLTATAIRIERPEPVSFFRSSVEQVPPHGFEKQVADEDSNDFGSKSLPLRSAVESVPAILVDERLPLRDAVEFRILDMDHEIEDTVSKVKNVVNKQKIKLIPIDTKDVESFRVLPFQDKYAAYVLPKQPANKPMPYRAGSPYQQLLSSKDVAVVQNSYSKILGLQKAAPNEYKVLCHMTNWGFYRKGEAQFVPENLDPSLCTHIIYSFATLDPSTLTMKEFDSWADLDNNMYYRTIAAAGNVPVLLGLGGWTDSVGNKYSEMVGSAANRRNFITNAIVFLKRHGFSGLHLDWNYPVCWQSDCSKGSDSDRTNFSKLIQEIKAAFTPENLLISTSISGYKEVLMVSYDIADLSKYVDFMAVMTYDYHGSWEEQTGHVSPLYGSSYDKYPQYNTDYTMQLLVKMGADKRKLIVGVPFYGQTFTLAQTTRATPGEGSPTIGPGTAGDDTRQPGMLAYYEICQRVRKQKWKVGRDADMKSGPYATNGDQWVGYDDPVSVTAKARYVMKSGFGGMAAWTVDLDDYQNRCCEERFPILRAINRALGRLASPVPTGMDCTRPNQPATPKPAEMTFSPDSGIPSTTSTPAHSHTTWPSWTPESTTTTRRTTTSTTPSTTSTTSTTTTTTPRPTTRRTTTSTTTTSSPPTTTTSSPPTTTVGTTIPVPGLVMPELSNAESCEGNQYKAHPTNCNSYYRCVLSEFKQQFCAGGLHWNDAAKLCDWPASAKCEMDMGTPEPTTTSTTARPTRPASRRTTTTPRTTPTTTEEMVTSRPTRRKTTVAANTPSPTRPTKKPVTTTKKPANRPTETCNNGEYYPHRNCDSFYICVNEKKVAQQCGPGLYWSQEDKSCDWEDNVNCVSNEQYFRLLTTTFGALKLLSEDDPCDGNSHVPFPGDCNQYLVCNWGRLESASCADGLHWNQQLKICDWPANAKCAQGGIPESTENISDENNAWQGPGQDIDGPQYVVSTTEKRTTTTRSTTIAPATPPPVLEPLSGYYKMVCYFTNWAWYRKGYGKYTPDHIRTDLCTHIVYGFAVLDYSTLTIKTHDSWADIDNNFYTRVVAAKEKGVKVTLAIGGWNDSAGDKYSRLVRSAAARSKFVAHVIGFLEKYGFEGLDLDWEYPVCWQVDCKKGFADEKEGFTELVRELSEAFRPRGWLLSAAVSPSKTVIDAGYDVAALAKYFDWIAVMTYDFHGQWDKQTGHVAPLYYHPEDEIDFFNANYSINYWIEKGAPSRKIVMGMPLYGQSFQLADTKKNGLNAKAPGPGQAGEFTRAAGFLAYYEICDRIQNKGWTVVQDDLQRMGPYAYKGNQWVSFDDKESLLRKVQFIRAMDLGGGMIWALDLDDFKDRCGQGSHPLLTAIREGLRDPPAGSDVLPSIVQQSTGNENALEETSAGITSPEKQQPGPLDSSEEDNNVVESDEYKVVCYFTNWAWYRQGNGKYLPEDIDPELCTHIVYGFAVLDREGLTIKPHDSWADIDNRFYERVVEMKKKGKKVTVAIGGWNDSAGDKYSRLVRNAQARKRFVENVMQFIAKYNFDGLDLDWEYPVCWQVDCKKGYADEKEGFSSLVMELATAFKPHGYLLSSAVSPSKKVIDAGYDVRTLSDYMDWIAVMTYDYHGQWDKQTGHVAPMYEHSEDFDKTFNANFTIHYWIEQGADPRKLVMGMPMYGQSFSLADVNDNGLNAKTYGGGEAGDQTRARGFLSYYEICSNIQQKNWNVVRDRKGRMGPYAYKGDQWVSFDDQYMIRHKSEFIKAMGLGGAMIWALDLDDFRNICGCEEYPLLRTINRVLRNYPGPGPKCTLGSGKPSTERPTDRPTTAMMTTTTTRKPTTTTRTTTTARTTTLPTKAASTTRKTTRRTTTRTTTTSSRPTTPSIDDLDYNQSNSDCDGRLFVPHESDCSKYYICQHGKPTTTTRRTTTSTRRPTERPTTTTTTTTTSKPLPPSNEISPGNSDYKVVCYFTNWAWYRQGDGKYTPDDIDSTLCTHIVYGFAVLDRESLQIKTHDSWADIDNRFYERVVEHKRKGTKVTLALGGWNDSLGDKYSKLVRDATARAKFVKHAVEFIEKYDFDGLDLDWEYPVCWQVDCQKGYPDEKEGFAKLVQELAVEFRPRSWLLSAAVSPSKMVIDAGYDVPVLAEYFDWIAVMTYDFHGNWDKQTGHVAPLYYYPGDTYDYFNANFSINYWIEKGAPSRKLVMGMPLYGQSFSLADARRNGLNEKSYGPGEAGEFTRAGGFLSFYEICDKVNRRGWSVQRDPQGRIGPYAYSGNQWVSYDDVDEIRRKSQFVKQMNLGGGMVWALDLDDFRGKCGCGTHPLLRTMNLELGRIQTQAPENCT